MKGIVMTGVNVGVLGCGFWGKNQARVYSELETSNLLAVADLDKNRAKEIGEKHDVKWYSDPAELIKRDDIEFISICTPTTTHAELALECIKAGKHVLVEKPVTDTVKEAENVIAAAEKKGVYVMVGFIERFNPAVRKARKMIRSGEIGEVVLASSKRVSRWPVRIGDVGVVKDLAIHDVDMFCHLFDRKVEQVYAEAGSHTHKYEDYANIILRFEDGVSAFVEANWLTPRKVRRLIVTGTAGIINVEYIKQEVTVENQDMMYMPFFKQEEPLKLELNHFIDSIKRDEKPTPSGEDGLMALRICEAALKSARSHNPEKP
jgi:UDP-N-acetylglucosamine 3-dehydrogenase